VHALATQVGQCEKDFVALAARRDHRQVGDAAVCHRPLASAEPPARNARLDRVRVWIARALGPGQRADTFSRRQPRQPCPSLRVAATAHDRLGGKIDRGTKRHRGQCAADFFREHTQRFVPQTGAAERFRDSGAEPAELRHLLPQLACERRRAFQHLPRLARAAMLGEETPGLRLQLFQFVGEIEVHCPFAPPLDRAACLI